MSNSQELKTVFNQLSEDLMEEKNYKKYQLPKEIGITYDLFLKISEYGKIPTPRILMRIADYFNISIEYLLGRTKNTYFDKAKTNSTFQERLKYLREQKHMTEYAVTQKLHVSTSYTTTWKNPKYLPALNYLITLSEIFKVSLDYLLGRTDDAIPYKLVDSEE